MSSFTWKCRTVVCITLAFKHNFINIPYRNCKKTRRTRYSVRCLQVSTADYVPKTSTKTAIYWKWQRASLQNFSWLLCMYKYVAAVLCLYYSSPVWRTFRSTSLARLRALLLEMEWFERMSIGHHQDRIIILKVTGVVCCGFPRCIRWARNVRIRKPNNARVVGLLRPDSIKQVCFGYSESVHCEP